MPDEVVDTPFGRFLVNPVEVVGATVKAGTVWDGPGFLQVIGREHGWLGKEGITILDVGAHLGDWTVWLVREGAWRVVTVEPAPVMLNYLKANLDLNKAVCADRVIVIPVAAYSRTTVLRWAVPYEPNASGGAALTPEHLAAHADQTMIAAAPLDDYRMLFGERVSLIKIDAQGCDAQALRGLAETIRRDRPVIVFEWEAELAKAHGDTLEATIDWLAGQEYETKEWPSPQHNYLARPKESM